MNETLPSDEIWHLSGFYEPFSAMSHLFGAVLFVYLGALLLRRGRGDTARLIYLGVFAFSCVLLFSMSGIYHMMVRDTAARVVMGRLDHGAIFLLIAGTFTPAHGILLTGCQRWGPLALVWTGAIAGITLKSIYFDDMNHALGLSLYLGLGWLGAFSGYLLWRQYGWRLIKPALYGGIAYSLGGLMEAFGWAHLIPGVVHPHELFHVMVLIGALYHWAFVWSFANCNVPSRKR